MIRKLLMSIFKQLECCKFEKCGNDKSDSINNFPISLIMNNFKNGKLNNE